MVTLFHHITLIVFPVYFFVQKTKSLIWRKESLRNILASGNLFQLSNWNPTLIHHLIERYLIPLPPYFTVGLWWFQNWDHPNVQTEDQKTNHFTLMCGLGKKGSYISSFSTLFFPVFLDRNERNSIQIRDLHLKLLCPIYSLKYLLFFLWDIWSVSNLLQDNLHVCFFFLLFFVILHSCA